MNDATTTKSPMTKVERALVAKFDSEMTWRWNSPDGLESFLNGMPADEIPGRDRVFLGRILRALRRAGR